MADFARAMAMIIRAQLSGPDNQIVPGSQYDELFAVHGTIMLLLFALDPAARAWQEGAGAAGLHGLTVCDAAWGCVMWGRRRTVAAPAGEVERWMVPCMSAPAESMPSRQSSGPL